MNTIFADYIARIKVFRSLGQTGLSSAADVNVLKVEKMAQEKAPSFHGAAGGQPLRFRRTASERDWA